MTKTESLETARASLGVLTVAGCHGCETQLVCPEHDQFLHNVPVGSVVRRVHPNYPRLFRVKASQGDWVTCEAIRKDGARDERFAVGWSGSMRRSQWEIVTARKAAR